MRTEHHQATSSSHRRPLALGANAADQADAGDNPGRFADTGRLSEKRTDGIVKGMLKLKIGDRESCSLFVRAMEYELKNFRHAAAAEPPPAAPEPTPQAAAPAAASSELESVARTARELASLVQTIPKAIKPGLLQNLEAQDEMRRGYDERYLDQLWIEALRLAAACGVEPTHPAGAAPTVQPAAPAVSAAAVDFISSLCHMFEECFERPPTADPDGAFARVLALLSDGIGIAIPNDPATLELALSRA